jgi:hypothetical protein
MDDEEFEIWRDYTPDDDCKELKQLEIELEKIVKKEEKEKVCDHCSAFFDKFIRVVLIDKIFADIGERSDS